MNTDAPLTFGEFCLDRGSGHLYRGGRAVPLTPKAFALLDCLVRYAGRLLTKEELLSSVWPGVFVGDAVLKVAIREIRRALADDPRSPRFIETAHRRGYRFIAPVDAATSSLPAEVSQGTSAGVVVVPRVRYAQSGRVNIAYQVFGSGQIDLVFVMGWVSHLEYFWNEPSFARFLTRLGSMGRLILFDKRGTGLSDPVPVTELPTLEERLDDVRAVMQAAGSERAVLVGVSEGGPMCSLFAATYPERTEALVMIGSYARRMRDADYPWGPTAEEREAFCETLLHQWGGPVGIEERAPSRAADPAFRDWWASYLRMGASPGAAVALTRMNAQIDIRDVLSTIRVPTLVLHRRGDRCLVAEEGRYLASRIPGATFCELPGEDHLPFVGNQEEILLEIERFLQSARVHRRPDRVLATVLTIDASTGSPAGADLQQAFAREVAAFRGRTIGPQGSRLAALFDGPGRAVQCACTIAAWARHSARVIRAGLHIGECDVGAVEGPIMEISAAIAGAARPGEILVSRTVVDLVAGSGFGFAERGSLRPAGLRRALPVLAVIGRSSSRWSDYRAV